MNCFYYIDKPLNISSFFLIKQLRKILNIRSIWHTGTLDPLATWAMLIAVWSYTKLIPYLENTKKTYEFIVSLDWTSPSYDLWEKITYLDKINQDKFSRELDLDNIKNILNLNFTWKIKQSPPIYSAIKINWNRAYSMARSWLNFDLKERIVNIFNIEILNFKYPLLKLRAEVSAGTYIRSIANKLGQIIWSWWYISYLRRTKIWDLDISLSQNIDNFFINNRLEEKKLFNNIIYLEEEILFKLNNWMRIKKDFNLLAKEKLFVSNKEWIITNIVEYIDGVLYPIKSLL